MCEWCADGRFRFETTKLAGPDGGQVKGVLHPVSVDFDEGYSRPTTGSMILATRDVSQEDIWPDSGFYISQVMPDGSRRARFGGYLGQSIVSPQSPGAITVPFVSTDTALNKRLVAGPNSPYQLISARVVSVPPTNSLVAIKLRKPTGVETFQTIVETIRPATRSAVPVFLVTAARGNLESDGSQGVTLLDAVEDEPSEVDTDNPFVEQTFEWWDVKSIGQIIAETVQADDGPKYWLEHTYENGYWFTLMHFSDDIGRAWDYTLKSDRELWQYGLTVDGSQTANRVYGIGSGEEWETQFSVAYDLNRDTDYPEWQVTQAWKDQTSQTNLDGLTRGWVADHRDPTTIPTGILVGLPDYDPSAPDFNPQKGFPAPEDCRPGDTFLVDIGYGAATVKDVRVRNLGVSWSLREGAPVERVIAMQPVDRPAVSVKTQTPAKPPSGDLPVTQTDPQSGGGGSVTADPWPARGKLTNITANGLAEVSGMEVSVQNPGYAWVMNDEQQNPQVQLINLKNGGTAATFTPNPGVSAAPVGDPESLRLSRVSGRLVIADTGDNALNRPTSGNNQPHLVALPEPRGAGNKGSLAATRYPIAYPNGERVNCETLLIHPTTDQVYLLSKESTRCRVFGYGPLSAMSTANNVGTLVATLNIQNVSDGSHTLKGGFILILNNTTKVPVLKSDFRYAGAALDIPAMSKAEALAVRDSCSFVVTGEGANPPIYQQLIPNAFGATCATPEGPDGGGGSTPTNPSATVPGQLINMNGWKLQLPIN